MRAKGLFLCLLASPILSNSTIAFAAADEDAALSHSEFTKPIVLHIGSDGFSQAQRLKALNGVNNERVYGARYRTREFLPCGGRREYTGLPSVQAHIGGYNFNSGVIDRWLSDNQIIQVETYNIRYPNASMADSYGGEDTYPCPILNENGFFSLASG